MFSRQFFRQHWAFAVLLLVQSLLIAFTFSKYFTRPREFMFQNAFDGLKNYYTLQYYVAHNPPGEYAKFMGMNYPYGDYIFYTDNTPAVAFLLRLLQQAGMPVGDYAIPLYHWLILANLLLASVLAFAIGRRLRLAPGLNVLMSVAMVWVSPQLFRLFGSANMAFASFYLGAILLLWVYFERLGRGGRLWPPALGLAGLLTLAAFFHLYHLPILGIMVGAFGFFAVFFQKTWPQRLGALGLAAIPLLALTLTMSVIRFVDADYAQRPVGNGYGLTEWRLAPESIFRAYGFVQTPPLLRTEGWALEQFSFLGSGVLYGAALALGLALVFVRRVRNSARTSSGIASGRVFVGILLISGLICWSTAAGDYVKLFDGKIQYDNWLSPFYFLKYLTPQVTQFRYLSRFNWGDFYPAWLAVFYIVDRLAFKNGLPKAAGFALAGLVSAVTVVDVANFTRYYHSDSFYENLFQEKHLRGLPGLDYSRYQAILPLPFFHVGNENIDLIADDHGKISERAFQISLRSGLPIVACKMSRTPADMTRAHYSLILEGAQPDPALLARFNEKPVLVVELKRYDTPANPQKTAERVLASSKTFVQRHGLQRVGEDFDCYYYEWILPGR